MNRRAQQILLGLLGGGTYGGQLLNLARNNLIALWPLAETSGTVATDSSGNGFHGTYTASVTLSAAVFPDGTGAPLFDASADVVSLPFAALDTPFDPLLGTLAFWYRVRAASVWTDGVLRVPVSFGNNGSNRVLPNKATAVNSFDVYYSAGGTTKLRSMSTSATTWLHIGMSWNVAQDRLRGFLNGAQVGADVTGLGTWVGALANGVTAIGNSNGAGGAAHCDGYVKYVGLWNAELTPAQIASAVPASFLA